MAQTEHVQPSGVFLVAGPSVWNLLPDNFCEPTLSSEIDTHTHTHSVKMAIYPDETRLAGCLLNSLCSFIPELRILWGCAVFAGLNLLCHSYQT